MRHVYFRFALGIVFAACLVFSAISMNLPFAVLYLVLSIVFLASAHALWRKDKDKDHRR